MKSNFDIIFDNGGGVTIQHPAYIHHYGNMKSAALDVAALLLGSDPEDWEGNEPEHKVDYDHQTVANGGYRWFESSGLAGVSPVEHGGWGNIENFFDELRVTSLPPKEVARIIKKVIPNGNASKFARRMGVNEGIIRKYAREGIKIEAIAWAFRAIDKQPSLLGGEDPPGTSEFDKGILTAIAVVVALFGIKQARMILIYAKLEHADISGLPEVTRAALLRLNSYHGIDLIC